MKRPTTRRLLEMAFDLGGDPDSVDPQHKRAWASGEHSLRGNPAIENSGHVERHAAATYRNILTNLRRYGGHVPRNNSPRELQQTAVDMFQTLHEIQQFEADHTGELERLAVETVLRLPEFKSLRSAVGAGDVVIRAFLNREIDIEGAVLSDERPEPPAETQVPQIRAEYDEMIHRRRLTNMFIQGAAVANNYAFAYYARDELNQINPELVQDYGKLMAYSELGYFVQSPEIMRAAAQAGGTAAQGGDTRLRTGAEGSVEIVARGIAFPILVQEIIKGCMEFLALNDEDDDDTRTAVQQQADAIDDEQTHMQIGPSIWREFMDAIGHEQAEVMPYLKDMLAKLPASEYNARMKALISGSPEGKQWFRQAALQIKQKLDAEQG